MGVMGGGGGGGGGGVRITFYQIKKSNRGFCTCVGIFLEPLLSLPITGIFQPNTFTRS